MGFPATTAALEAVSSGRRISPSSPRQAPPCASPASPSRLRWRPRGPPPGPPTPGPQAPWRTDSPKTRPPCTPRRGAESRILCGRRSHRHHHRHRLRGGPRDWALPLPHHVPNGGPWPPTP